MSFTVKKHPTLPCLIVTVLPGFRLKRDMPESDRLTREILDAEGPLFNVLDLSQARLALSDVIDGANMGSRSSEPIWKDPRIRQTLLVTTSRVIEMAAAGMNSPAFGNLNVGVFPTLDDALQFVREQPPTPSGDSASGAFKEAE